MERRRREAPSETQPERNARRRAADGSLPLPAASAPCKLVTSARFEKWNGRRREGEGATGSPWSEANRALVTANRRIKDGLIPMMQDIIEPIQNYMMRL